MSTHLLQGMKQKILFLLLIINLVQDKWQILGQITNSNISKSIGGSRLYLFKGRLKRLNDNILNMCMGAQIFSSPNFTKAQQGKVLLGLKSNNESNCKWQNKKRQRYWSHNVKPENVCVGVCERERELKFLQVFIVILGIACKCTKHMPSFILRSTISSTKVCHLSS